MVRYPASSVLRNVERTGENKAAVANYGGLAPRAKSGLDKGWRYNAQFLVSTWIGLSPSLTSNNLVSGLRFSTITKVLEW